MTTRPTRPLTIGDILHGYAGGVFGRDHYDCCRIEAVGPDWIVARDDDGYPSFATGRRSLQALQRNRDEECTIARTRRFDGDPGAACPLGVDRVNASAADERVEQLARALAGAAFLNPQRDAPPWDNLAEADRNHYREQARGIHNAGPYEKPTREQLLATVERVRQLHQPTAGLGWKSNDDDTPCVYGEIARACSSCGTADEHAVPWPCETIRTLDEEQPDA